MSPEPPHDERLNAAPDRAAAEALLLARLEAGIDEPQRLRHRSVTGGDDEQRVSHLLSLLDDYGFLAEPSGPPLGLPDCIGHYRILDLLGSGGMGLVYLAEHQQLGRRVALKVLHDDLARTPRARARFQREALLASRLEHPGICTVYEIGSEGDRPFLAMQFVAGQTLAAAIDHARAVGAAQAVLPGTDGLPGILLFVERAALALHAAHEQGLVHRDVKPGNLMVTAAGQPVVLDFGLAMGDDADALGLTLSGDRLGTPAYMAPEQIAGRRVDRRSDVHALGAVLYECLALRPPFQAVHRESLFQQILQQDPEDLRRHHRAVSRDLWTVLQTALAKEPARRYATAATLAEDLRRVRMHEPILARRPGPLLRLSRFARRNPVAAAFVALLLVAITVVSVLLTQRTSLLARANAIEAAHRATDGSQAPVPALQESIAAVRQWGSAETISALYAALLQSREYVRLEHEHILVGRPQFSLRGDLVLTACRDGAARLWDLEGRLQAVFRHLQAVNCASFSPDGTRVLTGSMDGTAAVWQLSGRREFELPHGPTAADGMSWSDADFGCVTSACWSPDGQRIATGCSDRAVRIWDARTGQQIKSPITSHAAPPSLLAWSPDSRYLATADCDSFFDLGVDGGNVFVWEPGSESHSRLATLSHPRTLTSVAFARDGNSLLTACRDGHVRLWQLADLARPTVDVDVPLRGEALHAAFAADGTRFLAFSIGQAGLWDTTGKLQQQRFFDRVMSAYFGPSQLIAGGGPGNAVYLLDENLDQVLMFRGHTENPNDVSWSPDGRQLASACEDKTCRIWNVVEPDMPRLIGHTQRITGLANLPDGTILSTSDDGSARIWNLDGRELRALRVHAGTFGTGARLAPDATTFAVADWDGVVRIYDLEGKVKAEVAAPGQAGRPAFVEFLGTQRIAVGSGGTSSDVRVRSLDGIYDQVWSKKEAGVVCALGYAAKRAVLAGAGWNGHLTLWRDNGDLLVEVPTEGAGWIYALAFSPDEQLLATAGSDQVVRLWRFDERGRPVPAEAGVLRGHTDRVLSLAWSRDGRLLASGSSDGTTRLWDVPRREGVAVLHGHSRGGHASAINAVFFHTNGDLLLTAGDDGAIQCWPVSSDPDQLVEKLLAIAQDRVDRVFRGTPSIRRYLELVQAGQPAAATAAGIEIVATASRLGDPRQLGRLAGESLRVGAAGVDGDLDLALEAATKAVELTEHKDAAELATLAQVQWNRGERALAVVTQREVVALDSAEDKVERLREFERQLGANK